MEALTLTRKDFEEGWEVLEQASTEGAYLSQFAVTFPDGINTASTLEICRTIQNPTMEGKVHLMRLCIKGKNVQVTCPNGDVEKFCMNGVDDNLEAFPLFVKEPLAMLAIADNIYGYILKKYVRPSKVARGAAAKTE